MIVGGRRDHHRIDGVTTDSFTCQVCTWSGRFLVFKFMPLAFNDRTIGGSIVCPLCEQAIALSKRKYFSLGKIASGSDLVSALAEIEVRVEDARAKAVEG
jgi:hypothetical protein